MVARSKGPLEFGEFGYFVLIRQSGLIFTRSVYIIGYIISLQ